MGIAKLSKEAELLELALKVGGDISPALIEDLCLELELILSRINAATSSGETSDSSVVTSVDESAVAGLMAQLISLLEDFDVDAGKVIGQIKTQLGGGSSAQAMEKIEALVAEYDFESALELAVEFDIQSL